MNEGHLGKFGFGGERAATDNHPAIIRYLPLADSVAAALEVGTLLKRVDAEDSVAFAPLASADTAKPCAVVDLPCDLTGEKGETSRERSAACVVHGTVKNRLLKTGDGKTPTVIQLEDLAQNGIVAV